jgi:hypothetical protein
MILSKAAIFSVFLFLSVLINTFASDFIEGNIKLIVNERAGSFSLYYLTDPQNMRYSPLFYSREPRSSYISVSFDGNVHRLDRYNISRISSERLNGWPVVTYTAPAFTVTKEFSPVTTVSSHVANGIRLSITVQNTSNRPVPTGLRVLLDTHLGEERGNIPFVTNNRIITSETIIEGTSSETFWISRGNELSLMGSIIPHDSDSKIPDIVHMANWRRLNNAQWRLRFSRDRSFSSIPYSIRDSAVSYIYEPAILEAGGSFTYTIYLTTEDIAWYGETFTYDISAFETAERIDYDADLQLMLSLQQTLNSFIAGEITLTDDDLTDIERSIERLRTRLFYSR